MIDIQNLTFQYNNHPPVFYNFNWQVNSGETWSVLGSSGSGKTTLLHLIASLKKKTGGSIRIHSKILDRPRPQTGLIMQNHGLLPWATVEKNIRLGFRIRRFYGPDGKHSPSDFYSDKKTEKEATHFWMRRMGIDDLKDRYPRELSGGQQQRAAIARTLVLKPDLLLMDEPFSSLDPHTRTNLQELVLKLYKEEGFTGILVTHSISEALIMGKRILILGSDSQNHQIIDNPGFNDEDYRGCSDFKNLKLKIHEILGENLEQEN